MLEDIVIEPMTEELILWRCLHGGPLSRDTIDKVLSEDPQGWESHHAINVPLLKKIVRTYGTCAMLAKDGERIIGILRFYPKMLCYMEGEPGDLCLQQAPPAGPSEGLVDRRFPPLEEISDKTLTVHCMMTYKTGSAGQRKNPIQRKGIGTRMARELMGWAKEHRWEGIEATAYEDLEEIYSCTGCAERRFWEKLGFEVVSAEMSREFDGEGEFARIVREQAVAKGLDPEVAKNRYIMRLELT